MLLPSPTWGAYTDQYDVEEFLCFHDKDPRPAYHFGDIKHLQLSIHFSARRIPTPPVPAWFPIQYSLYFEFFPVIMCANPPLHLTSCRQHMSTCLLVRVSTTSLVFPSGFGHSSLRCVGVDVGFGVLTVWLAKTMILFPDLQLCEIEANVH